MSSLCTPLRLRAAGVVLLASALSTAAGSAQSSGDADLKAIGAYTLTMPKYQQYLDATVNLANVAAKDPSLAQRMDGMGDKSLGEQVKLLDGVPAVKGAITASGLTTRDFVLTQGALLQAGMAYALTKDAKMPDDEVVKKAGVSKANLEFYRQNEAEIGRLAKEARGRAPKVAE
jgi:hypothetical protein